MPIEGEEMQINLENRQKILSYIFSQQEVQVRDVRVATKYDAEEIQEIEKQIEEHKKKLIEGKGGAAAALREVVILEKNVVEIKSALVQYREKLLDANSDREVVLKSQAIGKEWKWFQTQSCEVVL